MSTATLTIHHPSDFDQAVWQTDTHFDATQYNEWLRVTKDALQEVKDILDDTQILADFGVTPDVIYRLGDLVNILSETKIVLKK